MHTNKRPQLILTLRVSSSLDHAPTHSTANEHFFHLPIERAADWPWNLYGLTIVVARLWENWLLVIATMGQL